jgi:hypothetical protein
MPNITMHLTANFYPPIPADIQLRVQEIFDELQRDSGPYILGWADVPENWDYDYSDDSVFDREYDLPNGARVRGWEMMNELRLWDAMFWDCDEPDELWADYEREQAEWDRQVPGQMRMDIA